MICWPSSQPLRKWSKQCTDIDYIHACNRYSIPGQDYCENHIRTKPNVVCLCGSTRFWETFRDVGLDLTMAGIVVLTIGICAPDSIVLAHSDTEHGMAQKDMLDALHKKKIGMANQILVLNVDGYIGNSTRAEIEYARYIDVPIKWLFPC